ncbi:MAG: bacterial transcriptional activator domain-containing protein, partial [Propionibacteriaceae bacterium]|nr:bacterial transcriptional activator domain-containing protein [Propionibacteriaceae bacterium]
GRITDPDLILPGWVLKVPLVVDATDAPAPASAPLPESAPDPELAPVPASADVPASPVEVPAEVEDGPTASEIDETEEGTQTLAPDAEAGPAAGLLGGMTALSAAAVIGGLGVRRRVQAHARPLGRRFAAPTGELSRYEAALTQVAPAEHGPGRVELLARAMRLLARHWWEQRQAALPLVHALVGPDDLEFVFGVTPASAPEGFTRVGDSLAVGWSALDALPEVDHPVAYPALVTLGEQGPDRLVMVDVMASGVLGVADEAGQAGEVLSAMLVELACAPWAAELDLLVVTADPRFADAAGDGRIACDREVEDGVAAVERLVRQRARFIPGSGWDAGRLDPDLAEAWSAQVVLFEVAPDADQLARLEAAIAGHACGVAAVAVVDPARDTSVDWVLSTDPAGARRLANSTVEVAPQAVPGDTRRALTDLYRLSQATTTQPAPWWETPSEDDVNIIALRPVPAPEPRTGPRLNLLGPVELLGCTGPTPDRARRQLIEYCAWLLLHPGASPQQMAASLVVAEGTRRSNMSRLRRWLGADPAGGLYLPDAYSGRIDLHPEVGSDWDELVLLTAGGVNRLPLERLVGALDLVRGAPLADAAPSQWGWAEEFRTDAAALIRDVGVVAARVARERGDLDTARWAANRALAAAPDDELLLGERIRIEHVAGRADEVQRLVARVTRTARMLGVDLLPETIDLCQEVLEGRVRARA